MNICITKISKFRLKRYQNTHDIDLVFYMFNKVPSITFKHCDIDLVGLQPSAGSFIWIQNVNQTVIANVVHAWKQLLHNDAQ